MVFISIEETDNLVTMNCHKGSKDGEYFQMVIDRATRKLVKRPEITGIDVSAAYSHVRSLLKEGLPLPKETVSEWG